MAEYCSPAHTLYASSKRFISTFFDCLSLEDSRSQVDYQIYQPGFVATKINNRSEVDALTYGTLKAAEGSLKDLLGKPNEIVYGGFRHEVASLALGWLGKYAKGAMGWGFKKEAQR